MPSDFADGDIPQTGLLERRQAAGLLRRTGGRLFDRGRSGPRAKYDGSGAKTTYQGKGGVSLSSPFNKLAFAVRYRETNFLLNDAVSRQGRRVIFDRDPRERVQKVAPFLQVDGDPYPS